MNFSKKGVVKKQHDIKSTGKRINTKLRVNLFRLTLVCVVLTGIIGVVAVTGAAKGIIESAPDISQVNIEPEGYTTHIFDKDGKLSQELIGAEANRVFVPIEKIPKHVQEAFIALEDERFYEHDGIDIPGIFRAGFSVLKTGDSFGGSTITQQLLKAKVFNYGNEPNIVDKVVRKLQEQYLAIKLEDEFTKDEILEAYLNNTNLGNGAYGVQTAAQAYFGKDIDELTLSEASVLAPMPLSPVRQNPINYPEANAKRRKACLDNMKRLGYISQKEYDEAMADDVYTRIKEYNEKKAATTYFSYFTDALIDEVLADLVEKKGYTAEQASNLLYSGGLSIYTTQDPKIQSIVDSYFTDESNFPAVGDGSYYELNYALSVDKANGDLIHYQTSDLIKYFEDYNDKEGKYYHENDSRKGISTLGLDKEDMESKIEEFKDAMLDEGDAIRAETKNIILQPQTSMTIMDQYTGHVVALYGGRGEKTGNRTINRASNAHRQVGSTFKVLAAYLPALDSAGFTLASVMDDSKYTYPGTNIEVTNWDHRYHGLTTAREGIYRSMNIVACRFMEAVTPRVSYDYLTKLGFELSSSGDDLNIPLALGAVTNGVTNMQLTAGYAAIANHGVYNKPVLYTKIVDHNGKVILSNEPSSEQVFKPSTAWLLTSAMQDVITRGTGSRLGFRNYRMPVAGKTGSAHSDDLWFVGYTPYYTAAIWTGFDYPFPQKNKSYQQDLWRNIMEEIHSSQKLEYKTFEKPDSITSAVICTKSGKLAIPGVCDHALSGNCTRTEYFAKGSVPTEYCDAHVKVSVCKKSGHFASPYCPAEDTEERVYLIKEETSPTDDTPYLYPTDERTESCPIHSEGTVAPPTEDTPTDEVTPTPEVEDPGHTNPPVIPPVIVPDDNQTSKPTITPEPATPQPTPPPAQPEPEVPDEPDVDEDDDLEQ